MNSLGGTATAATREAALGNFFAGTFAVSVLVCSLHAAVSTTEHNERNVGSNRIEGFTLKPLKKSLKMQ
jgi:hypothetical protein